MSLHFFAIPALDPAAAQAEFNRFCAGQRVVSVERQFVADGQASFWSLCVSVASGPGPLPDVLKAPEQRGAKGKVDYKEILSEAEFAHYADLRAWRKATAEREGRLSVSSVPCRSGLGREQCRKLLRALPAWRPRRPASADFLRPRPLRPVRACAIPPVRHDASCGGKLQGARGVGKRGDGIILPKTPRVAAFFPVMR